MWDAYHEAAQAKLSNVRRVVDRFHVMKNLNEALSKTQRSIQNQANEDTKALLKGCRWLLFKNRENMTGEEREKPDKMLAASPELKTCYELKEGFRHWLIQHSDRHTDKVDLQDQMVRVEATGFKALQAFVRTLTNWLDSIPNYFDGRHGKGFAEGVNLRVKMINRRGFGYCNFQHFRLHVLIAF